MYNYQYTGEIKGGGEYNNIGRGGQNGGFERKKGGSIEKECI